MVVSRNNEFPQIDIFINGNKFKQGDQFKYLDTLIPSDGRNNTEFASRIAQVKMNFQRIKQVQTNKYMPIHTRRRALVPHLTHPDVRVEGLDDLKMFKKETETVSRIWHNKITHK